MFLFLGFTHRIIHFDNLSTGQDPATQLRCCCSPAYKTSFQSCLSFLQNFCSSRLIMRSVVLPFVRSSVRSHTTSRATLERTKKKKKMSAPLRRTLSLGVRAAFRSPTTAMASSAWESVVVAPLAARTREATAFGGARPCPVLPCWILLVFFFFFFFLPGAQSAV